MNEQVASCADGVLCFLCFTAAILLLTNEKTISADIYLRGKSRTRITVVRTWFALWPWITLWTLITLWTWFTWCLSDSSASPHPYGRKSADRTEHGNDVIFFLSLAIVFGNLEIWLIRKHPYTAALIYFKKIFHFLTFQTSKLPKTVAKKRKNMTSFPCSVRPEKFHPYMDWTTLYHTSKKQVTLMIRNFKSFLDFRKMIDWARSRHYKFCTVCVVFHRQQNQKTFLLFGCMHDMLL